jgi:acetyl esterase
MTLNEDVARILEVIGPNGPDHLLPTTDDPVELERSLAGLRETRNAASTDDHGVVSEDMALPSGVRLRVYRPPVQRSTAIVLYMHGGGWVLGDIEGFDDFCRRFCAASGLMLASLEYRLAPEHPYPAALEDSEEALSWIGDHAEVLGADPKRIVVMGSSAGGNLAAVLAADRTGVGSAIVHQVLIYPALDSRLQHPSFTENATGMYLTSRQMRWYWNQYVPDPADREDPRVSPAHAPSLAGLPPAAVVVAEHDPLRDEGREYAARLEADGVSVELLEFPGQIHGFLAMSGVVAGAEQALELVAHTVSAALRRA